MKERRQRLRDTQTDRDHDILIEIRTKLDLLTGTVKDSIKRTDLIEIRMEKLERKYDIHHTETYLAEEHEIIEWTKGLRSNMAFSRAVLVSAGGIVGFLLSFIRHLLFP